jgi:hypothetical protein
VNLGCFGGLTKTIFKFIFRPGGHNENGCTRCRELLRELEKNMFQERLNSLLKKLERVPLS